MKAGGQFQLLSFNAGFVDTTGSLGLQGLFLAHITGNFVTLAATLVMGTHGVLAKVLVLPEFVLVLALGRIAGSRMKARGRPVLRIALAAMMCALLAFFVLAVVYGPFPDSDALPALITAFAGITAMAMQNAVQRVHFASMPPTTLMTGNITQAVLDADDLIWGIEKVDAAAIRARLVRTLRGIISFAAGCALGALLYYWFGFWCLAVPVAVGAVAAISTESRPL
jgi:uncharacterized membrane protein YoaK (UPF0700 family)